MWNCEQVRNYYADKVILSQLLILHRHSNDPGSTWLAAAHTYRPTTVTSRFPTSQVKSPQNEKKPRIFWQSWWVMRLGRSFAVSQAGGMRGHLAPRSSSPPAPKNVKGKVLNFCSEICNVSVKLTITPTEVCEYSLITKKKQNMLHKNPCYAK